MYYLHERYNNTTLNEYREMTESVKQVEWSLKTGYCCCWTALAVVTAIHYFNKPIGLWLTPWKKGRQGRRTVKT